VRRAPGGSGSAACLGAGGKEAKRGGGGAAPADFLLGPRIGDGRCGFDGFGTEGGGHAAERKKVLEGRPPMRGTGKARPDGLGLAAWVAARSRPWAVELDEAVGGRDH